MLARPVAAVIVVSCLAGLVAAGATLHVPSEFPSIQAAVDAALPGDAILVEPGTYRESVRIDSREDLLVAGDVPLTFSQAEFCWDAVAREAATVILSGTLTIRSSRRITVEGLTVTGLGPGICIEGNAGRASMDITIRYCNLVYNSGLGLDIRGNYHRVAIVCTNSLHNLFLQPPVAQVGGQDSDVVFAACMRTEPLHAIVEGGPIITVAVIDSGIDRAIPCLLCHAWTNADEVPGNGIDDDRNGYVDDIYGWDFRDGDADSLSGSPIHRHGTAVAGVLMHTFEAYAAGTGRQASLRIMDLRFLDSEALFYLSDWRKLADAIDYAVDNGARIINLSVYATREPPDYVRESVRQAIERGVLIVAIAGNDASHLGPIADWPEIMTVGAAKGSGTPASFSNSGPELDLLGNGVDVLSLVPGGLFGTFSGTSFAAPYVAGVAAFQLAQDVALSPDTVEALLRAMAVDIGTLGHDPGSGWGLIR